MLFIIKGGIKTLFRKFISKWFPIPICLLTCFGAYYYAKIQRPKYTGSLTFIACGVKYNNNIDELAQSLFYGDNLISLLRSKKIIKPILFKKVPKDDDLLINILIKDQDLFEKWRSKKKLKDLIPFKPNTRLIALQDSLVDEIIYIINKDILSINRNDKGSQVYEIQSTSGNQIFSSYFTRYIVEETSAVYIANKTYSEVEDLRILKKEADSLKHLLGVKLGSTLSETDRTFNLNAARQFETRLIQKSQLRVANVVTMYAQVLRSLIFAKVRLQTNTPLFEIIDIPIIPLKAIRVNEFIYGLVGLLAGLISSFTIVTVKKNLVNIAKEQKLIT